MEKIKLPLVKEVLLVPYHRLSDSQQRVSPLLDCIDNPLSRSNIILQKLSRSVTNLCVFRHIGVIVAYPQRRQS